MVVPTVSGNNYITPDWAKWRFEEIKDWNELADSIGRSRLSGRCSLPGNGGSGGVIEPLRTRSTLIVNLLVVRSRSVRSGFSPELFGFALAAGGGGALYGIALKKTRLNHFPLGRRKDALPTKVARALAVLSHDIGVFVDDLDEPVGLGALEVVTRKSSVVFLHLIPVYQSRIQIPPNRKIPYENEAKTVSDFSEYDPPQAVTRFRNSAGRDG
jgi:hypothetical protein